VLSSPIPRLPLLLLYNAVAEAKNRGPWRVLLRLHEHLRRLSRSAFSHSYAVGIAEGNAPMKHRVHLFNHHDNQIIYIL